MTYNDDFIPVESADEAFEGPQYPVAFGIELTPKVQGIALAVVGIAGAAFLFTRLVTPVQEEKAAIEGRIEDKRATLVDQEENLREIEAVRAELDNVLQQREGIYSLLGDASSLDTLLLDINQQIENSNAAIQSVIAGQLAVSQDTTALASIGLTQQQINRIIEAAAADPVFQRWAFTSELFTFNPVGLSSPVGAEEYGQELSGKLERQIVDVSFRALFNQSQNILYNLERLEPLIIIRNFEQEAADSPSGVDQDVLQSIGVQPLATSFTLEVLVPIGDPLALPEVEPPAAPAEGEEGAAEAESEE